jgi:hypothetical protein
LQCGGASDRNRCSLFEREVRWLRGRNQSARQA